MEGFFFLSDDDARGKARVNYNKRIQTLDVMNVGWLVAWVVGLLDD